MATKTTDDASQGVVAEVQEKTAEMMTTAREQVGSVAAEAREDAAFQLREQVDARSTQAGEQVEAFGSALRASTDRLRTEGKSSTAAIVDGLAERVEGLGSYLQSTDADRMLGDVEAFARRRPWVTAGAAALAGFVASRLVRASGERRYATRPDWQTTSRALPPAAVR
jgi:hypothetical protein